MADSYTVKQGDKFSPFTGQPITSPPGTLIYGDTKTKTDYGTTSNPPTVFNADTSPSYTVKEGDKFNPYTGKPLESVNIGALVQNPLSTNITPKVSEDDQKLLNMGLSMEDIKKLDSPKELDPLTFNSLIDKVNTKLSVNNELTKQREYIMQQMFGTPLTPDEKKQLPEDIKNIIDTGDRHQMELQLRILNDQIAGRANTLSQSIGYLAQGYQTGVKQLEEQKQNALNTVLNYAQSSGQKPSTILRALYPSLADELGSSLDNIAAPVLKTTGTTSTTGGGLGVDEIKKITGGSTEIDFNDPAQVAKLPVSEITKAIISGFGSVKDLTPTMKAEVLSELYHVGFNANQFVVNKLNNLVSQWQDIPEEFKGIIQGRIQPFASSRSKEVATFESNKQVLTRQIARLNDVGVLSDQDVKSYSDAMPGRGDANIDIVKAKISGLSSAVTGKPTTVSDSASLSMQVKSKGYDYEKMKADGYSDLEIKQALNL